MINSDRRHPCTGLGYVMNIKTINALQNSQSSPREKHIVVLLDVLGMQCHTTVFSLNLHIGTWANPGLLDYR